MNQDEAQAAPRAEEKKNRIAGGVGFLIMAALAFLVVFLDYKGAPLFPMELWGKIIILVAVVTSTAIGLALLFTAVTPEGTTELKNDTLDYPLY